MSLQVKKLDFYITKKEMYKGYTCTLDDEIIISLSRYKGIRSDIGKCYFIDTNDFKNIITYILNVKNSLTLKGYSVVPLDDKILKNIYIILNRIKDENLDITFEHQIEILKNCIINIKEKEIIYAFMY